MPSLILRKKGGDKIFRLTKNIMTIGCDDECDIVLKGGGVSSFHARIVFDGTRHIIQGMGSGETAYVNKKRLKGAHTLQEGDEIRVGDMVMYFHPVLESRPDNDNFSGLCVEDLKRILDFSRRLAGKYDVNELLQAIMDSIVEITRASKGFLFLLGDEGQVRISVHNLSKEDAEDSIRGYSNTILRKAMEEKRPLIVSDALHDSEFDTSKSVADLRLSSVMCVPLMVKGELIGAVYLGNDRVTNLFSDRDLEIITILTAQASLLIKNAILVNDLKVDFKELSKRLEGAYTSKIIGSCTKMDRVFRTMEKVAPTDLSVLLIGETGTGKELIAREIHMRSRRAKGPFVAVNCGAIPDNLLESEFFGYVKGAFTGAVGSKIGKFEAASNGTIFLDEIGEMPVHLQVKILRVLEERMVTPLGETESRTVDTRFIAATNMDLEEAVEQGKFRKDLFFRLNEITIFIPPIREREADIILIARYLLERYLKELVEGKSKVFTREAIEAMKGYRWSGNIREMENKIKRAIVMTDGVEIGPADLELEGVEEKEILSLDEARKRFDREYIRDVLALNNFNRNKAAADLGISPRTLFRFLAKDGKE